MKRMKKVLASLLAIVMFAAVLISTPLTTDAKTIKTYPTAYCFYRNAGKLLRIGPDTAYLKSVTSSNKNVISVPEKSNYPQGINYSTTGAGSSVLTYKMKKNGKTYTAKQKYVVVKKCPFKKVVVNGKNVTKQVANPMNQPIKINSNKFKLEWAVSPEFKVCKVDQTQCSEYTSSEPTLYKQSGKKNFKDTRIIHINVRDKKGNYYGDFHFSVNCKK